MGPRSERQGPTRLDLAEHVRQRQGGASPPALVSFQLHRGPLQLVPFGDAGSASQPADPPREQARAHPVGQVLGQPQVADSRPGVAASRAEATCQSEPSLQERQVPAAGPGHPHVEADRLGGHPARREGTRGLGRPPRTLSPDALPGSRGGPEQHEGLLRLLAGQGDLSELRRAGAACRRRGSQGPLQGRQPLDGVLQAPCETVPLGTSEPPGRRVLRARGDLDRGGEGLQLTLRQVDPQQGVVGSRPVRLFGGDLQGAQQGLAGSRELALFGQRRAERQPERSQDLGGQGALQGGLGGQPDLVRPIAAAPARDAAQGRPDPVVLVGEQALQIGPRLRRVGPASGLLEGGGFGERGRRGQKRPCRSSPLPSGTSCRSVSPSGTTAPVTATRAPTPHSPRVVKR